MSRSSPGDRPGKALSVLDAAAAVFLSHGFSAATTDMIQRQAGVSKATLYHFFPSKEAMFTAVIERQCATMTSSVNAIQPAVGDIATTLSGIGRAYLDIVLSEVGLALFRVVAAESPRFPDAGRRFYLAGTKAVAALVAKRLHEAAQAGEIDIQAVGLDDAASLFIGLVRAEGQVQCLMHPNARPSAEQLDRWVRQAVDVFHGRFGVRTKAA